ncbi:MAG: Vps62-related protein [Candidatus Woesearchaeota archaeon]|nr:Vps62-related protein [Candidatus Woesearchaeota archaeon]
MACASVSIVDDFNRPDTQDVGAGSPFIIYERPVNELDQLTTYDNDGNVYIEDGMLTLKENNFCDVTGASLYFGNKFNISTNQNGSISFTWSNTDNGGSNRWVNFINFGENLYNTTAFTQSCVGQGNRKLWWVAGGNSNHGRKNFIRLFFDKSFPNEIRIGGGVCGANSIIIPNAGENKLNISLTFDIQNNVTKIKVNNGIDKVIQCNLDKAKIINSVTLETVTNQGNTISMMRVDNLNITKHTQPSPPQTDPLLQKYAPVFYMHPQETYPLNDIASLMDNADLYKSSLVSELPITVEEITGLEDSDEYSMDMPSSDPTDQNQMPHPSMFSSYSPKVYGRITNKDGYTHLQYFMFYPYQNFYTSMHESDWEMVEVTLDSADELESVGYFFGPFSMFYYDPSLITFEETHPVVYVGKGSHSNFASPGVIPLPNLLQHLEFLYDFANSLKDIEKLAQGVAYVPEEGILDGSVVYGLEQIRLTSGWPDYEGLWGQKTNAVTTSGVKGPKFNSRFARQWSQPDIHTQSPHIPFLGAFLYSPLDMSAKSDGQELDYSFYTGPDEDPEALIVTGKKNYTLYLDSVGEGQFTLVAYYYDNDTETGIEVRYKNITTTLGAKGWIDFPGFILYMDYNNDGKYDEFSYPDEYVTYNGYPLPDSDGDGVIDFEDNCVYEANTNQKDSTDDGKGDACDSPRYYKELALEKLKELDDGYCTQFAIRKVGDSLKRKYWRGDFEVTFLSVFIDEQIASRKIKEDEINELLARADKMLVEKKLKEFNPRNKGEKTRLKLAKSFYEEAEEEYEEGDYTEAIMYYGKAWVVL